VFQQTQQFPRKSRTNELSTTLTRLFIAAKQLAEFIPPAKCICRQDISVQVALLPSKGCCTSPSSDGMGTARVRDRSQPESRVLQSVDRTTIATFGNEFFIREYPIHRPF
jgi:hypothetical protein